MDQKFTLNQCLRLLYGELIPDEAIMLKDLIHDVPELRAAYMDMYNAKKALDTNMVNPPASSVSKILDYSRSNSVQLSF